MKKGFFGLLAGLCFILSTTVVMALPVDLSTFTTDEGTVDGVVVSSNVVTLSELSDVHAIYYYNDAFEVSDIATVLTFDYSFSLAHENLDYFVFEVNFGLEPGLELLQSSSGTFTCDMRLFRGQTVSLAWGLCSDYDDALYESTATISNIDLATEDAPAPVPEPATLILFGIGLLGAAGFTRGRDKPSRTRS